MLSVVFIGTSSFAIPTLEALYNDSRFKILGVITQPAKPVGRKQEVVSSPVEEKAKKLRLKIWSPEKINDLSAELTLLSPDCLVVASYGQIIPETILKIPHLGAFNIHPSFLPKYRGPSPIPAALINGETETGVTIMLMDKEMDHGPILRQEKIQIEPDMTTPQLLGITSRAGAKLLPETILDFKAKKITPEPQRDSEATFSKIFYREDGKIDFKKTAIEIYNQYRALLPWPGIFAYTDDADASRFPDEKNKINNRGKKTLKLIRLARAEHSADYAPGTIFLEDNKLFLETNGGALEILELQLEGGKPLNVKAFINGHSKKLPLLLN